MAKCIINSIEDYLALTGKVLGHSEWFNISQEVIDRFADATNDHQWIHVDTEKARSESPYKTTIAHGYLTLSLLPYFLSQIIEVNNISQLINYGIDKMVFKAVVPVDSEIRLQATLKSAKDLGNICLATIHCIFQLAGSETPVLEGDIKYLYYFK